MNQSQTNFYRWLVEKKGIDPDEIEYQSGATPDFICGDEEWDVKKLYGNRILLYSENQVGYIEYGGDNSHLVIMPESPTDSTPLFIIPCVELFVEAETIFNDLEEWCVRDRIPPRLRYERLSIEPQGIREKINIYFKDRRTLAKIDEKVERGEYRNRSHAVESIIRGHFSVGDYSGPF